MPIYLQSVKRNPRARRNMAFPKIVTLPSGMSVQVDDMAELLALTGGHAPASSGGSAAAPSDDRSSGGGRSSSRRSSSSGGGRGRGSRKARTFEPRPDGTPVSYSQGRLIGNSVGGMVNYCQPQEGESHGDALTRMGLDFNKASEVITQLMEAGVHRSWGGQPTGLALIAQRILTEVGGITCSTKTKNNPASWGRRRW